MQNVRAVNPPAFSNKLALRGDKKSPSPRNILSDPQRKILKIKHALGRIRYLNAKRKKHPELFWLNGFDLELLHLEQEIRLAKREITSRKHNGGAL